MRSGAGLAGKSDAAQPNEQPSHPPAPPLRPTPAAWASTLQSGAQRCRRRGASTPQTGSLQRPSVGGALQPQGRAAAGAAAGVCIWRACTWLARCKNASSWRIADLRCPAAPVPPAGWRRSVIDLSGTTPTGSTFLQGELFGGVGERGKNVLHMPKASPPASIAAAERGSLGPSMQLVWSLCNSTGDGCATPPALPRTRPAAGGGFRRPDRRLGHGAIHGARGAFHEAQHGARPAAVEHNLAAAQARRRRRRRLHQHWLASWPAVPCMA